jgi:hypothetical protein
MSSKTVAVVEQESFSNFPAFHATMSDQLIYEEALRRAGIMTSHTPLTFPGFPPTYAAYLHLPPHQIQGMVPHSQLAHFEAEMHNLRLECQAFKAFQAAEAARHLREKAEAEAEAERVAAEAENARLRAAELTRQEQAEAVELAKRMFEDAFTRDHYRRPDKQLIEIGLRLNAGPNAGPPPAYPIPLLPYWRDKSYKG